MRKLSSIAISLVFASVAALPVQSYAADEVVHGKGKVEGTGVVHGKGIVKGSGTASGKGVVIYRDKNGHIRTKKGTGTVSGKGIVIGRGTVAGTGKAAGKGRAVKR